MVVKLYYNTSDGSIARILWTAGEQAQYPDAPAGTTLFTFDDVTNPALGDITDATSLRNAQSFWRVQGGVLQKFSRLTQTWTTVTVAALSQEAQDDVDIGGIWSNLAADRSPSTVELRKALRWLVRDARKRRANG